MMLLYAPTANGSFPSESLEPGKKLNYFPPKPAQPIHANVFCSELHSVSVDGARLFAKV